MSVTQTLMSKAQMPLRLPQTDLQKGGLIFYLKPA